ncbi:hypothetical protein L7F22_050795 [Adiantum nelumboides]|nr:hypothetical protein [Adiantum nelumboides]
MVRASSQGRQPVIETDPWDSTVFISRYNKSSSRRVVYKLCGDVLTGGVTRLKAHYSWIGSKGKESCKSVTEDLWLAFGGERARYITIMPSLHGPISEEALLEKVQAEKAKLATHHHPLVAASSAPQASTPNVPFVSPTPRARNVATSVEDSNVGGDATQGSIGDVDASQATPISTTHPPPQPQVQQHVAGSSRKRARGSSARSSTLHDVWAPSLKNQAEITEERFFYQCNIAFHASRTGAYKRFVNAVYAAAAAGAPITPAGSEALRTSRLTRQVDMVHEMLGGHRESWALYGCTIISDGWKDVRKRHLLNIIVSCCTDTTFLRAIDVSGVGIRITEFLSSLSSYMQNRLVKCKDDLRRMVVDERWLNWPDSTSIPAVYLHDEVICNNAFWREIDGLQAALQPIVCVLCLCDSEGSTLGLLYEFMIRLRRAIQECTTLSSDRVDAMLEIFDARWNWFRRSIHCVAHMLHPAWRSDAQRSDRVLLTGWNTYVERIYRDNGRMQNQLEEDLLEYRGGKENFSRGIAKDAENQALPLSWWEKFGGLNPALQCLDLRVLSQEVSSSGAERLWSIMGDIHTKDRNRLNTPQLDRLAFVNANLRVLEKLQPRTPEDDVYDFIREDMMRFSRQTRSTTRRLRGESAVGTSSARPQRAARARRRTRSVAELTSASRRLTPTPSECESDDSCESDGSEE